MYNMAKSSFGHINNTLGPFVRSSATPPVQKWALKVPKDDFTHDIIHNIIKKKTYKNEPKYHGRF